MSSALKFDANVRTKMGRQVNSLRREGLVPANIVAKGKDSRAIQAEYNLVESVINKVGYTQPVEINLDGSPVIALITDVTLVPARNTIEHVTFQEVRKGELITADVPVQLVGDAPGVVSGMLVLQMADTVEIEAGALSIPEFVELDISSLENDGDSLQASDIAIPEGSTLKTDADAGIVRIEAPRVEEEEPEEERSIDDIEVENGGDTDDDEESKD